jgi:hypothetical protein
VLEEKLFVRPARKLRCDAGLLRQFPWTGDTSYFDSVLSNLYERSVSEYVAAWDPDQDGVEVRARGNSLVLPGVRPLIGADLMAAQCPNPCRRRTVQTTIERGVDQQTAISVTVPVSPGQTRTARRD